LRLRGVGVVVDTNVWISGLLTRTGAPALLTRQVVLHGRPVFTADTFGELSDRLWRPKFDRYVTLERRKGLLGDLDAIAQWVDVPSTIAARAFCRDAADDKFIHAAMAGGAHWLVTGDKDLLVLAADLAALGVTVLSAAEALARPEFALPV
jgi:putative PIN family toxin of toxin-antitoxin system